VGAKTMMRVTFKHPGKPSHTYGRYEMESIPRKGDEVTFDNPELGTVTYEVGDSAEYKFVNPLRNQAIEYPAAVTVWIYGPVGSSATAHMT
jgi:hypothetical protein